MFIFFTESCNHILQDLPSKPQCFAATGQRCARWRRQGPHLRDSLMLGCINFFFHVSCLRTVLSLRDSLIYIQKIHWVIFRKICLEVRILFSYVQMLIINSLLVSRHFVPLESKTHTRTHGIIFYFGLWARSLS